MRTLVICSLIFLCSCGAAVNASDIPGKWQVIDFDAKMPDVSPMLILAAREEAVSTVFVLSNDGNFAETSNFNPEGIEGSWVFSTSNNSLQVTDSQGSERVFVIESINDGRMIWVQELDELGSMSYILKNTE